MSNSKTKLPRAVVYLRVSYQGQVDTDYDPEGNSIPAQRDACTRKAAELGAQVIEEYVEPGRSALNVDKRPEFQKMMARIKQHQDIDYVIVYARSRTHRNALDAALTKRDLRAVGASLVSVMDYTEDSFTGDLVAHIIDGVNEYQSRASGADVSYKMGAKVARGGTVGPAKLGYLNARDKIDGREVRTIATDPDRAGFITMMFELYATGKYSFRQLREAITNAGLRTRPGKKQPAGGPVSIRKIGDILRDRYYLGYVQYKDQEYQGRHDALVSQELFDRAQRVLYEQRGAGKRDRVHDHYLKGVVWCARCKRRLIIEPARSKTGRVYFYFICIGRQTHDCDLPRLSALQVEKQVETHLATLTIPTRTADKLRERMSHIVAADKDSTQAMQRHLKAERKRLEKQEDQYLDLVGDPDWPQDKLTAKMRAIRDQKTALDTQLAETDTTALVNAQSAINTMLQLLADPQAAYRQADDDTRRTFTHTCFARLWINSDDDTGPHIPRDDLKAPLAPLLPVHRTHTTKNGAPTQGDAVIDQGSSKNQLVPWVGLEPTLYGF